MTVRYTVERDVATIVLDRPEKRNALSSEMHEQLEQYLGGLRDDQIVRCLVLKGAGPSFCAGDDLGSARRASGPTLSVEDKWRDSHLRICLGLLSVPIPTIAVVTGHALGAGLDLALACDFRLASDDAVLGTPVVRQGLAGAGIFMLSQFLGMGRATEAVMLGEAFDAQAALALGLVNRVYPGVDLTSETDVWTQRLASGPTGTYGVIKRARLRTIGADLRSGFDAQLQSSVDLQFLRDPAEGRRAWTERRAPDFPGGYRPVGE